MRYVIEMGTDYCGTDTREFVEFADDASDRFIEEEAWSMALEHAGSYYDVYPCGEEPDEGGGGDHWITTDQVWYTIVHWTEDEHGPWPHKI